MSAPPRPMSAPPAQHVAMQEARRLDLVWLGDQTAEYDELKGRADAAREPMPEYLKGILRQLTSKK